MCAAFRRFPVIATAVMLTSVGLAVGPARADAIPASSVVVQPVQPASRAPHPVAPHVRTYAVRGVSHAGLRTLSAAKKNLGQGLAALSAPEPASGFAVTGATWTGRVPQGLHLSVRTRTAGHWSTWTPMQYDTDHGPSPTSAEFTKARPGTDPFVVGRVDDVQLAVRTDSGRVPAGLSLAIIDPGTSAQDASPAPITPAQVAAISVPSLAGNGVSSATNAPVTTQSATPMPTIYSRSDWGADESLRGCCVEYGKVHAGFVHHTVNANAYSRADVPAILRGIYAYHTQTKGWRDIGYNFLIDRFGRIWEGRYGGITLPVIGAHTLNYNENAFAASAIGNYDIAQPSAAMIDAFARLYAWKLSLHGIRPKSRQKVSGTTFNAISGHRDAAQTACPGRYLYAQIPSIIAKASRYQRRFTGRQTQHSFVRDSRPDLLLVTRAGSVSVARGTGPPGFAAPTTSASTPTLPGMDLVTPVRDVTGDRLGDLMARSASTGRTFLYPGAGDGTFGAPIDSGATWAGVTLFAGTGDITGDGVNDVVARGDTGSLLVYPGRGDGTFGRSRVAMADATGFDLVTAAGDFNADGFSDLITRGVHGAIFVWFGDGTGHFPTNRRIAHDWSGKDAISGGVDLTGDHHPDVVARSARTHDVSTYADLGGVTLSPAIGRRRTHASFLAVSSDLTGDHRPDLVSTNHTDQVKIFAGRRSDWVHPPVSLHRSWPGVDAPIVVGDWNGDGYVDAMARERRTGTMSLYPGTSGGGFDASVGSWPGWGTRHSITPVGDFNGDGRADLMAQASNGAVYLYPGRGLRGVGAPILMRSSLPTNSSIMTAGLWNKDGAPDLLVRTSSGQILMYPGNGPGGLGDPIQIATGFGAYTSLVGVGDLTGDGHPDLVGRLPGGQTWLIPGQGVSAKAPGGGFGRREFLAADWSAYRLG